VKERIREDGRNGKERKREAGNLVGMGSRGAGHTAGIK
jgi:hypothetical protein